MSAPRLKAESRAYFRALGTLTFLGHAKDSLWSLDLFRCESLGRVGADHCEPAGNFRAGRKFRDRLDC